MFLDLHYFISLVFLLLPCPALSNEQPTVTELFRSLTNERSYNKWLIPPTRSGGPVKVMVRAYVYHLQTKETINLDISMTILLELVWRDTRLAFDERQAGGLRKVTGGHEHLTLVWLPRVIFSNERESQIMGSVSKDDFLTLLSDGLVILTKRIKVSMYCYLQLGSFPFDQQDCEVSMDSWRYNSSQMQLMWDKSLPLQVHGVSSSLAEFDVLSIRRESSVDEIAEDTLDEQRRSSLTIRMKLGRCYGYYFLNYYLPSVLLVIISWVQFWYTPSAVPGRVVLGTATMLTFIQLCWSARGIQKVSQFMANDVWALTCTGFIFASLAEFAFVNTIDRKGEGSKLELKKLTSKYILRGGVDTAAGRAKLRRASSLPSSPELKRHVTSLLENKIKAIKTLRKASTGRSGGGGSDGPAMRRKSMFIPESSPLVTMTPHEIATWIDNKSKVFFPSAFFIFNLFYWLPLVILFNQRG